MLLNLMIGFLLLFLYFDLYIPILAFAAVSVASMAFLPHTSEPDYSYKY